MIMDLEDKIRNPKPPRKNQKNKAAMAKKYQEAVDRLGGIDKYNEAVRESEIELSKSMHEFQDVIDATKEYEWEDRLGKHRTESTDRFNNGEIDEIEQNQMDTQWLRDAIHQIHEEGDRRRKSKQDALEKKEQEAVDRLGGEDEFEEALEEAGQELDKARDEFESVADDEWKGLWIEQWLKSDDKYNNVEIDIIEKYKMDTQWLRDAIRKIKGGQDKILDDMIMDLEDKIRNPKPPRKKKLANKNPIGVDGKYYWLGTELTPEEYELMHEMHRELRRIDSEIEELESSGAYDKSIGSRMNARARIKGKKFLYFPRSTHGFGSGVAESIKQSLDEGKISIEDWKRYVRFLQRFDPKSEADAKQIMDELESRIDNPKPKRRKNPMDVDSMRKKWQEAVDRLGGEDELQKAIEEAGQEFGDSWDEFWKIADVKWKGLWAGQARKSRDKYFNGEIDKIEEHKMDTQWLKNAIRKIKREQQIQDVDLDDMIMELESKVDDNPQGSGSTRKNPKPTRKKANTIEQRERLAMERFNRVIETSGDDAAAEVFPEFKRAYDKWKSFASDEDREFYLNDYLNEQIGIYEKTEVECIYILWMTEEMLKQIFNELTVGMGEDAKELLKDKAKKLAKPLKKMKSKRVKKGSPSDLEYLDPEYLQNLRKSIHELNKAIEILGWDYPEQRMATFHQWQDVYYKWRYEASDTDGNADDYLYCKFVDGQREMKDAGEISDKEYWENLIKWLQGDMSRRTKGAPGKARKPSPNPDDAQALKQQSAQLKQEHKKLWSQSEDYLMSLPKKRRDQISQAIFERRMRQPQPLQTKEDITAYYNSWIDYHAFWINLYRDLLEGKL
jgi:hypothetical protein